MFVDREEEVVEFFVQYYGGADNKQGLRPLVDAIEQCDTLLRYARPSSLTRGSLSIHPQRITRDSSLTRGLVADTCLVHPRYLHILVLIPAW